MVHEKEQGKDKLPVLFLGVRRFYNKVLGIEDGSLEQVRELPRAKEYFDLVSRFEDHLTRGSRPEINLEKLVGITVSLQMRSYYDRKPETEFTVYDSRTLGFFRRAGYVVMGVGDVHGLRQANNVVVEGHPDIVGERLLWDLAQNLWQSVPEKERDDFALVRLTGDQFCLVSRRAQYKGRENRRVRRDFFRRSLEFVAENTSAMFLSTDLAGKQEVTFEKACLRDVSRARRRRDFVRFDKVHWGKVITTVRQFHPELEETIQAMIRLFPPEIAERLILPMEKVLVDPLLQEIASESGAMAFVDGRDLVKHLNGFPDRGPWVMALVDSVGKLKVANDFDSLGDRAGDKVICDYARMALASGVRTLFRKDEHGDTYVLLPLEGSERIINALARTQSDRANWLQVHSRKGEDFTFPAIVTAGFRVLNDLTVEELNGAIREIHDIKRRAFPQAFKELISGGELPVEVWQAIAQNVINPMKGRGPRALLALGATRGDFEILARFYDRNGVFRPSQCLKFQEYIQQRFAI